MKISPTPLAGAFLAQGGCHADERGAFMRLFCARESRKAGAAFNVAQINFSHSVRKHTLRGMHYLLPPSGEAKWVGCLRGEAQDVIIDLRPRSPTFKRHYSVVLRARGDMLHIPKGFAHGFLTLVDDCEIFYAHDEFYDASRERGIRHDDKEFNLPWLAAPAVVSAKDQNWRDFCPDWHLSGMDSLPADAPDKGQ